jgi:hypothetical protein
MLKKAIVIVMVSLMLINLVFQCKRTMSEPPPQGPTYLLGEVTKTWVPRRVPVSDGFTYRYRLHDRFDTAIHYQTGPDTFEVVTTFKKYVPNRPALPDIITKVDDNVLTGGQVYFPTVSAGDNIVNQAGWSHFKGQTWNEPHYNKTGSFVDLVPGAYLELTFTGYQVEWWTEKRVNHGIATVEIDGGTPVDVDLYAATESNNTQKVFTSAVLSNSTHKIKVSYTGKKNTAATQTNLLHDYFVTYKKQ